MLLWGLRRLRHRRAPLLALSAAAQNLHLLWSHRREQIGVGLDRECDDEPPDKRLRVLVPHQRKAAERIFDQLAHRAQIVVLARNRITVRRLQPIVCRHGR
jgi:hypothetical protein